jgi:hypothetical protein
VRILALTVVLVAVAGAVGIAVTAVAGDDAEALPAKTIASETAPPDAAPVRPLLPMPAAANTATGATPLREASSDAPLLIAAIYWLLLAGIVLRRIAARRELLAI